MNRSHFLVLGAGPAGLGAAYRLASSGFPVTVLEQQDHVGGLAASFDVLGMRVDHGSHRLHPATPAPILEFFRSRLGGELQLRHRRGRIRIQGRWIDFPLSPASLATGLSPALLARIGLSALGASLSRQRDHTFEEYVSTRLGRGMGEIFYFPYAQKIWGVDPSRLSGVQARRRISADSPGRLLHRVLFGRSEPGGTFYYPARGFGCIPEALAGAAVEAGADIRLGSQVARIDFGGTKPVVVTADGSSHEADHVWSTLPVTGLARMAGYPRGVNLRYRSMLLVYLGLPTERYTPYDAHYFPEAEVPITRLSEPKNYRDGPDPPDATVLCAEIPCSDEDEIWGWSDGDLAALVGDGLQRSGLEAPTPVEVVVKRLRHAYPVYSVGYEEDLDPLLDWVDSHPQLLSFGRQGLFAHDNTHHALAMAWAASDAVTPDGAFDATAWSRARHRFDKHVVED